MIKFLYSIFVYSPKNNTIKGWYKKIVIRLINILLNRWFLITPSHKKDSYLVKKNYEDELFIVSLTTFPARIEKVWIAIESMLRQRQKPNKIILWLYKGEFNGKESLPKRLLRQEKRGLEIRFCEENLMPHKKYFYTMLEFPEANVITIDDDIIYPPDLLEKLIAQHAKYANTICCTTARKITTENGKLSAYKEWKYINLNKEPSKDLLPIGVGGVLYPPNTLHQELMNKSSLKKIALRADDLWLKTMSLLNNTKVTAIAGEYSHFFIPIRIKHDKRLMDENIGEGRNDKIFNELLKHYQIPVSIFETEQP